MAARAWAWRSPRHRRTPPAAACPASTLDAAPCWRTWSSPYRKQRTLACFPTASDLTVIGRCTDVTELGLRRAGRASANVDADRMQAVGAVRQSTGGGRSLPGALAIAGTHGYLIMPGCERGLKAPE